MNPHDVTVLVPDTKKTPVRGEVRKRDVPSEANS